MDYKLSYERLVDYHLTISNEGLSFKPFKDDGIGFTLFTFESETYSIYLQSAENSQETVVKLCESICQDKHAIQDIYSLLSGGFQLYVWDKQVKELQCVSDYIGLGSALYSHKENGEIAFFPNYIHFKELDIPLVVSQKGIISQFGFGYHCEPFPYLYKNIFPMTGRNLYIATYDGVKIEKLEIQTFTTNAEIIPSLFKKAIDATHYTNKCFIGATAGVDSLAIMSSLHKDTNYKIGNFGSQKSADVKQGESIAKSLGIDYSTISVCNANEFSKYSQKIADVSGGLATCSYVDMMKFVNELIPKDYAYLMGEAGSAWSDFLDDSALDELVTPIEYLKTCFTKENFKCFDNYPEVLREGIMYNFEDGDTRKTFLNFYRFGRMSGNFSNRYRILGAYRDKTMPFVNADLIKASYKLDYKHYLKRGLNRKIIKENNENLLHYHDNAMKGTEGSQNWPNRIKADVGETFFQLLKENLEGVSSIFDEQSVLELMRSEIKKPGRGIYFLFRVLSLALFVKSQNITKIELENV